MWQWFISEFTRFIMEVWCYIVKWWYITIFFSSALSAKYWNIFIPLKQFDFFYIVLSFPLLVFTHSPHTVGSVLHCSHRQTQLVKQKRQISCKFQSTLLGFFYSVRYFSRHNFHFLVVWIPSNVAIYIFNAYFYVEACSSFCIPDFFFF